MPPRPLPPPVTRRRVTRALDSDARVVVLSGPLGSGRTTALRLWASGRTDVVWLQGSAMGALGGVTDGVLLVDDVDLLTARDRDELDAALQRRPSLRLRASVHSPGCLPQAWEAEVVRDLALTREEVGELVAAWGSGVDPSLLWFLTGGLPAAIVQALSAGATTREQVIDVLAGQRHVGLPMGSKDLALPHHLTARVVEELGGPPDFLDQAERAGWGSWDPDPAGGVFTLTAPRRLGVAARRRLPPTLEKGLRSRVATILLQEGRSRAALADAAAAGNLALVDAALKQGGMPLLVQHGYEVNQHLSGLPTLKLHGYPIIALARALVLNARGAHTLRAVEMFGIAVVGARAHPKRAADRALMGVVESVAARVVGLGDGGVRAAARAARTLAELGAEERRSLGGLEPDLHLHAAVSLLQGDALSGAKEEFERALNSETRPTVRLQALGGLALAHALDGDLTAARHWSGIAADEEWDPEAYDGYPGSMLRIADAALALEALDFPDAERRLEPLWRIIDTIEHWPLILAVDSLVRLATNRAEAGLERFREVRRLRSSRRGTPGTMGARLDHAEVLLELGTGDADAAHSVVARLSAQPLAHALASATVLQAERRDQEALALLDDVDVTPTRPRHRSVLAVLRAVSLHRTGRSGAAEQEVGELRRLHEAHGLRTPLLLVPADARHVLGDLMTGVPNAVEQSASGPVLTPRERVVLAELVHTGNLARTANRLRVSVNTVKTQRRSLYRKLAAGSREEALAAARAHGLLD